MLVDRVLIPFLISLIAGVVVHLITRRGWKLSGIVVLVAFAVLVGGAFLLAPYEVRDVVWCSTANEGVRVTGRLTSTLTYRAVPGYAVQIKIYEAGTSDPPFKGPAPAMTGVDGGFSVDFPPPVPAAAKLYVINAAYEVGDNAREAKWYIKDFAAGPLGPCR
jgi:hypothetical protein